MSQTEIVVVGYYVNVSDDDDDYDGVSDNDESNDYDKIVVEQHIQNNENNYC